MINPLATATLVVAGLSLSMCAQQAKQDAQFINGTLSDPDVQAAIANLQKLNQGVVCLIAAGSTLTAEVAKDLKATATVNGATIGAAASSTICAALGGTVPALAPAATK